MFTQARRRLTVAYVAMFFVVLVTFTVAFLVLLSIVLEPNFDLAPDTSSDQAAEMAYQSAVERIGLALIGADVVAVVVVSIGAWLLAARTIGPIREAHERQRRFVADASHEMRTPLTAIRATTESVLGDEQASPESQRSALQTVASAAAELGTLTSDLLALAQSEEASPASLAPLDLSIVVAERLALRNAAHSDQHVEAHFASDLAVNGSAEDIARVLDNLVDNAFRYGGQGVRVAVSTKRRDRHALLEVADSGPGIASADIAHIFDPFFRVRSDAQAPEGTGLGLAIALALAKRNRGRLTVISQPGQGATFRLTLPLSRWGV